MPRDLPVGNGNVLINFDKEYRLRDIYYPHVGQENHTIGHVSNFGVWSDGKFAWMGAPGWHVKREYLKESLVTDVQCNNAELGLDIRIHDVVDYHLNIYVRELKVHNLENKQRKVRLFFHHDFHIYGNEVGDTAYFDPRTEAVLHYKKNRWFLTKSAGTNHHGVKMWSVGNKEVGGCDGTYRDAEDGELGCNGIAQGSVDSTICAELEIPANGEEIAHYWICFGKSYEEVVALDQHVTDRKPAYFVPHNQNYWRLWVNPEHMDFHGLSPKVIDLFKRSLLVVRSQIDNDGAIIAANDHDIAQFARDTYSYMWPRDGALVAYALTRAGYRDVAQRFFTFCSEVIKEDGYLLHKYNPDKSLASSWHPWVRDGKEAMPIQEDETALVLWCLWQNFRKFRNIEFFKPLIPRLLFNGADFLVRYRDEETKLPLPSWDLWEERYGVHLFTVCSVIAGLQSAASFCYALGELERHRIYQETAEEVQQAMLKHMWNEKENRFCRMATRTASGYNLDMTVDAAMYAVYAFAGLNAHDPKVKATMDAIKDKLWIKTDVGGVARYQDDYYHQVTKDVEKVPGNPWFICTMWLAGYQIAGARGPADLHDASKILEWVADRALPSGVLAEQVHPYTNDPLSVSPLTWSHAVFITVVLDYLEKQKMLMVENVFTHTITPV